MKRVYVAGAYSAGDVIKVLDNIREGLRWATKVFLMGYAPFAPWLDFHFQLMLREGENLTVNNYYEYSLAWLRAADIVFVIPNWENSRGTIREIDEAMRLDIPVVYDINELQNICGK
jgi:hypothetical protein